MADKTCSNKCCRWNDEIGWHNWTMFQFPFCPETGEALLPDGRTEPQVSEQVALDAIRRAIGEAYEYPSHGPREREFLRDAKEDAKLLAIGHKGG